MSTAKLEAAVSKLEAALDRIEAKLGGASAGSAAGDSGAEKQSIRGWDSEVQPLIDEWLAMSAKLGGVAAEQAATAKATFDAFRGVLISAASEAKPAGDAAMTKLGGWLGPVGAKLGEVQQFAEKHRTSPQLNHLKTVAEGIGSLSWIAEALPAPFIDQARSSAEFWSNKILREFKGKDENQVAWVTKFTDLLKAMSAYAKKVHTRGLMWNY